MTDTRPTFGSLFAGIGGFDLGFERAGMRCVWQVEIDSFCRKVLAKHWPDVRRHDDVRTFPKKCRFCEVFLEQFRCNQPDECDCPECQGLCECDDCGVDVICGGFPCQDISVAGKGIGIEGSRSGLWREYLRIVRLLRPRFVVVENVSALLDRGMCRVLGDLAASGYDAEWDCLPASAFGSPHQRDRVFLVAHARGVIGERRVLPDRLDDFPRNDEWRTSQGVKSGRGWKRWLNAACEAVDGAITTTDFYGVDDGLSEGLDGHKPYGNAVVPQVAEWIGRRLVEAMKAQ